MAPARTLLAEARHTITPATPRLTLLSNADGQAVTSGTEVLDRLVDQVSRPVRWDLCMEAISRCGVEAAIELTPASVLTGLVRRQLKGLPTAQVNTPADLPALVSLPALTTIPTHADEVGTTAGNPGPTVGSADATH
jgi:[acyl-carrier-protein] S-malonyltransferase